MYGTINEYPEYPLPSEVLGRLAAAVTAHGLVPDEMLTEEDLERRFVTCSAIDVSDPRAVVASFFASQRITPSTEPDWDRPAALFHPSGMVYYETEGLYRGWRPFHEYLGTLRKQSPFLAVADFVFSVGSHMKPTEDTLRLTVQYDWVLQTVSDVLSRGHPQIDFHLWYGKGRWWIISLILRDGRGVVAY